MVVIRREQMDAFGLLGSTEFKDFMVRHITHHFPVHAEVWGKDLMLAVVEDGAAAGRKHGLASGRDLCHFIDFRVMLGASFDTDPQLPFAARILADRNLPAPTDRLNRLYDAVRSYLDAVVGRGQVFALKPLRGMAGYPLERLEKGLAAGVTRGILAEFREIWPQKHRQVGDEALTRLVAKGIEEAGKHGFTDVRAVGYYLILLYLLGHGCATDAQYPWLAEALSAPEAKTPEQRFRLLYSKSQAALSKFLSLAV